MRAEPPPFDLDDYDYHLPPGCIAQHPPAERDGGRLLVLDRASGAMEHAAVADLARFLDPGDLLVLNATRVRPARLRGRKASGGRAEALLLGPAGSAGRYRALLRSRGRQRSGQKLVFARGGERVEAEVVAVEADGCVELAFAEGVSPYRVGETPLPPYIRRDAPDPDDVERYQTTFARVPGSVAAPTAGLHLSERLLAALAERGVGRVELVLHVGPGTFRPLQPADLEAGRLHAEPFDLPADVARRIAETRRAGRRVVAVGTTSARVLEARSGDDGVPRPGAGETDLFVRPGHVFRGVDALLTNFHLPRSSLLLLVAAFAGREALLRAYAEAVRRDYRFYSYGDAMLVR